MRKVMLVIDNYNEMVTIESILRRVGFDVMSLGKDVLVKDALLRFNPDVIIATFDGRSVDGLRLAGRLIKLTPRPRVALMHTKTQKIDLSGDAKSWIDAMIESPVIPRRVLQMAAQLCAIDPIPLLKKYEKLGVGSGLPQLDETIVSDERANALAATVTATPQSVAGFPNWDPKVNAGTATTARTARSDRYAEFLNQHADENVDGVLPRDKSKEAFQKLKEAALSEKEQLDRIDAEKRAFVKAMFSEVKAGDKTPAKKR